MRSQVAAFVSHRWSIAQNLLQIDVQPLHGGLESDVSLAHIAGEFGDRSIPTRVVIKRLPPGFEREADVYDLLWRHLAQPPAVRVLGLEKLGQETYLYLEDMQPHSSWPWSSTAYAAVVCRELAHLHESSDVPVDALSWDYEVQLARSAEATLHVAEASRDSAGRRYWRRLGALRRVIAALPAIRRRLLSGDTALIHGDVHPGNVVLRIEEAGPRAVLIDWSRARIGSPLEDIASWLHSLGCWEPRARQRHDTLMRAYLDSRRVRRSFNASTRADYWFASASNALSGAIRYHLAVLADTGSDERERYDSRLALAAWERVVRQAATPVSTNEDRCT